MALPYPSMSFVPLDILTAEEMNHMVANDQYLNTQVDLKANSSNLVRSDFVIYTTGNTGEDRDRTLTTNLGRTIVFRIINFGSGGCIVGGGENVQYMKITANSSYDTVQAGNYSRQAGVAGLESNQYNYYTAYVVAENASYSTTGQVNASVGASDFANNGKEFSSGGDVTATNIVYETWRQHPTSSQTGQNIWNGDMLFKLDGVSGFMQRVANRCRARSAGMVPGAYVRKQLTSTFYSTITLSIIESAS